MFSTALIIMPIFFQDKNLVYLFIMVLIANSLNLSELLEPHILKKNMGTLLARADTIQTGVYAISIAIAILTRSSLPFFGLCILLQSLTRLLVLKCSPICRNEFVVDKSISLESAITLIKHGFPFLISSVSILIYMRIDQVFLGLISTPFEAGNYSTAVKISEVFFFIPTIIINSCTQKIADSVHQNDDLLETVEVKKLYKKILLIGLLITVASIGMSQFIVLIFGEQYALAGRVLLYLAPSSIAVSAGLASSMWLTVKGYGWVISVRTIFGASVNIILNILLIPKFGASGAAVATTVAYFASVYLIGIIYKSTRSNIQLLLFPL